MLCHTYPGPGRMGRLRVTCAECGTETNRAAPVCAVCGACRRAAISSGGRAGRFPRGGSVRVSEVFNHSPAAWL